MFLLYLPKFEIFAFLLQLQKFWILNPSVSPLTCGKFIYIVNHFCFYFENYYYRYIIYYKLAAILLYRRVFYKLLQYVKHTAKPSSALIYVVELTVDFSLFNLSIFSATLWKNVEMFTGTKYHLIQHGFQPGEQKKSIGLRFWEQGSNMILNQIILLYLLFFSVKLFCLAQNILIVYTV